MPNGRIGRRFLATDASADKAIVGSEVIDAAGSITPKLVVQFVGSSSVVSNDADANHQTIKIVQNIVQAFAVVDADVWFVTDGRNEGVASFVGDAVRKVRNDRFFCLGVTLADNHSNLDLNDLDANYKLFLLVKDDADKKFVSKLLNFDNLTYRLNIALGHDYDDVRCYLEDANCPVLVIAVREASMDSNNNTENESGIFSNSAMSPATDAQTQRTIPLCFESVIQGLINVKTIKITSNTEPHAIQREIVGAFNSRDMSEMFRLSFLQDCPHVVQFVRLDSNNVENNVWQECFETYSHLKKLRPNLLVHIFGSLPADIKDTAVKFIQQIISSVMQADGWVVCTGDKSLALMIDRIIAGTVDFERKCSQFAYFQVSSWEAAGWVQVCKRKDGDPAPNYGRNRNYRLLFATEDDKMDFCLHNLDKLCLNVPMLHVVVGGSRQSSAASLAIDILSAYKFPAIVLRGISDFGKLLSDQSEALTAADNNNGLLAADATGNVGKEKIQTFLKEKEGKIKIISVGTDGTETTESMLIETLFEAKVCSPISILTLARCWDELDAVDWVREEISVLQQHPNEVLDIFITAICNGQGQFCQRLNDLGVITLESLMAAKDDNILQDVFKKVFENKVSEVMASRVDFFSKLMAEAKWSRHSDIIVGRTFANVIGCYLDELVEEFPEDAPRIENVPDGTGYLDELVEELPEDGPQLENVRDGTSAGISEKKIQMQRYGAQNISERSVVGSLSMYENIRILFLFAIVIHSDELATFVWIQGSDLIGTALFGARLARRLAVRAEKAGLVDLQKDYEDSASLWQQRAIQTIKRFHDCRPREAMEWLTVALPTWQDYSTLEVAYYAEQPSFMLQQAVQAKLKELWTAKSDNRLSLENRFWIALTVTLMSLILFSASILVGHQHEVLGWILKGYVIWWAFDSLVASSIQTYSRKTLNQFKEKCYSFFTNVNDVSDLIGFLALLTALAFSFTSLPRMYVMAIYGLAHVVYWSKMFYFFYIFEKLGTKVVMLYKMITGDFFFFFLLYAVTLVAFAVPIFATAKPESSLDVGGVASLFYDPLWHIAGISLDDSKKHVESSCLKFNETNNSCIQQQFNHFGAAYFLIFLVITNIILLNMLIAMLSRTVDVIFAESAGIWCCKRFEIIDDFYHRTAFPPPLAILSKILSASTRSSLTSPRISDHEAQSGTDGIQDSTLKKILPFGKKRYSKLAQYEHLAAIHVVNVEARNSEFNKQ